MLNLYPHQRKAVDELSNGKILVGGVGTGKTITSLVYFSEKIQKGDPTSVDLYVITTARKRDSLDWQKEAAQIAVIPTVDSWNNIEKYKDVKNAFFIFDEQRVVGSGSWVKAFLKITQQNRWILLSATPGDTWLDYIPVFVANGFYKNRTEFKREHCVYSYFGKYPKLERYVSVGRLVRYRNAIQVEMPYERHTTRHIREVPVEYDRDLLRKVVKERWHVYEERPLRDVSELFSVMRKVVNSDATRLDAIRSLMSSHPRMIVFYNFDYELEILRGLISSNITSSTNRDASSAEASSVEEMSRARCSETLADQTANLGEDETCTHDLSCQIKTIQRSLKPHFPKDTGNTTVGLLASKSRSPLNEKLVQPVELTNGNSSREGNGSSHDLSKDGDIYVEDLRSGLFGDQELQGSVKIAEWNGHRHDPVPTSDRWVYLVQYVAGAEAWNCTSTNAVVFYSLTYSYKNFEQAQGRIDRLDTAFLNLFYYVLISKAQIDVAIAKCLKAKKSFNEADFVS